MANPGPARLFLSSLQFITLHDRPPPGTEHVNPSPVSSLMLIGWDDDDRVYAGQFEPDHPHFSDALERKPPSRDTMLAIDAVMEMLPDEAVFPKFPDDGECLAMAPESCTGEDFYQTTKLPAKVRGTER